MMDIKEIIEDIADEEGDEDECEPKEHDKKERHRSSIEFATGNMGQDFQLSVKGPNCEKTFEKLLGKIRKNMPTVKRDGSYH